MDYKSYKTYKDTGVEWLGTVPEHWDASRLKASVSSVKNGDWGSEPEESPLVCVRVADFNRQSFSIELGDDPTVRDYELLKVESRRLKAGDLLIEKSGGGEKQLVGAVVYCGENCDGAMYSNFTARMVVSNEFSARFVTYVHASAYASRLNGRSIKQSTGIQNLDTDQYFTERWYWPPIDEQKEIASYLDRETTRIDALIEKKQRLIELLKEKRQAVITRAVTKGLDPNVPMKDSGVEWLGEVPEHWSVSRLKHECSHIVDCLHSTPTYVEDGEYPAIRTADISPGDLDLENARRVYAIEYQERISRLKPQYGDIVYSREGERFGMAAEIPEDREACLGQRVMMFRPSKDSDSRFLMWQLNSTWVYWQADQDVIGATSPHVNVATIKNFLLAMPPREEQMAIAMHIDTLLSKVDWVVQKTAESIVLLREHRAALITAAVTGQIDVRNVA